MVNVLGDAIVCGPEGYPDGGIIISNAFVEEVYAVGAVFEYPGRDFLVSIVRGQGKGIRDERLSPRWH